MDQHTAPVLDATGGFHSDGMATYALPGHRLGRGIDTDTATILSAGAFAADVLMAKQAAPDAEAGERFNRAVVDYLRAGAAAGMALPDAADPQLKTFRVVR